MLGCFIVVFSLLFIGGCSTMSAKERSEAIYKQQMVDMAGCTPGNSCLGDVLSSKPDLSNPKTKAAYDKEHRKVNLFMQEIKDCVAENQVQIEHGLPPKRNCSELAVKKRSKAAGIGVGDYERARVRVWSRFYPHYYPYRFNPYPYNRYKYYRYPRYGYRDYR